MEYTLYENKLTTDVTDDFVARTVNVKTKTSKDLITAMTGPGSILKDTECNAVIGDYWKRIVGFMSEGAFYSDDHIRVRMDIVGVFMGDKDRFDPERHELRVSIQPSAQLKEALLGIPLEYVKPDKTLPEIESVYDWGSETTNEQLTPNASLEITGDNLKVYTDQEEQGVFFINTDNGTVTKAASVRANEPKFLSLRVPALEAGAYKIEVRNTSRNGKSLRVGTSETALTVS